MKMTKHNVSFSDRYFYNSNSVLNDYIRNRKQKKELLNNGFKVINITLREAIKNEIRQNATRTKWIFSPNYNGQNFDKFGFKDKKLISSTFGVTRKKIKFKDGALHIYRKSFKANSQYFTIYVFIDDDRKIVKTVYYLD